MEEEGEDTAAAVVVVDRPIAVRGVAEGVEVEASRSFPPSGVTTATTMMNTTLCNSIQTPYTLPYNLSHTSTVESHFEKTIPIENCSTTIYSQTQSGTKLLAHSILPDPLTASAPTSFSLLQNPPASSTSSFSPLPCC